MVLEGKGGALLTAFKGFLILLVLLLTLESNRTELKVLSCPKRVIKEPFGKNL